MLRGIANGLGAVRVVVAASSVLATSTLACGVLLVGSTDEDNPAGTSTPSHDDGGDGGDATSVDGAEVDSSDGAIVAEAESGVPCPKCASGHCETGPCDPLVFVTDEDFTGSFDEITDAGGIDKLDVACNRSAKKANVPGYYRAWASEDLTGIEPDRLTPSPRPYRLRSGVIVVPSFEGWKRPTGLDHPLSMTASGVEIIGKPVWTGTTVDWSKPSVPQDTRDCEGWTNGLASGEQGIAGITACNPGDLCAPDHWTFRTTESCNTRAHVYCLEQVP